MDTKNNTLKTIVITVSVLAILACAGGLALARVTGTIAAAAMPISIQETTVVTGFNESYVFDQDYGYDSETTDVAEYTKTTWGFNETPLSPTVRQIARLVNSGCYYYDVWIESDRTWELNCYQ